MIEKNEINVVTIQEIFDTPQWQNSGSIVHAAYFMLQQIERVLHKGE